MNPSVGSESIGAILLLKDPKTLLMRLGYFVSRMMKPTKKAYSTVEKMVLALMFATQRFWAYLLPRHFVIITVEDTFPHILEHMDVFARISKWIVQLQEFDYTNSDGGGVHTGSSSWHPDPSVQGEEREEGA